MSGPEGGARMPTRRHALIGFVAAAGIGIGGLAATPVGQALAGQLSGSTTGIAGAVVLPTSTPSTPAASTGSTQIVPATPSRSGSAGSAPTAAPAGSAHWRAAVAAAAVAAGARPTATARRTDLPMMISRLTPAFRSRLDRATRAAAADGVRIKVTSGWRSPAQQERLIRYYTRKVGSRTAAYRWALPVDQSRHVSGEAVDIRSGAAWLRSHGAGFGLCRRYRSEPWHFEMLTAPGGRCPALEDHPVAH